MDRPEIEEQYRTAVAALDSLYEQKAKGAMTRCKANWLAQGEKNTKYFFQLERDRGQQGHLMKVQTASGETTDFKDIQQAITEYYQQLYASTETLTPTQKQCEYIEQLQLPQIPEQQVQQLIAPITQQEIRQAIWSSKDGKTPGVDGIGIEFYKQFWPELKQHLETMYNWQLTSEEGKLTETQNHGLIKLLPKKDKDLRQVANWRPITLLCCDYKILAKVLAQRLKRVLPKIIHADQTGFMKGRYIGENVRMLLDIMEWTHERQKPGIMISLDIDKGFDKLSHAFLAETMQAFGFPAQYIEWIQRLYAGQSSQAMNYGYTTPHVPVRRGVRQGCPLSPYIFLLPMEVFATAIRQDTKVQGIKIDGREFKVSGYADDTTVVVATIPSLVRTLQHTKWFGQVSGLNNSVEKTQAKGLGCWENVQQIVANVRISSQPIKVLGIWMTRENKLLQQLNLQPKLDKMAKLLKGGWHSRGLTIQGRIQVARALGMSQLIYGLTSLAVDQEWCHRANQVLNEFIWGGKKKAKIRHTILVQEYAQGGLKAPDV